MKKKEKASRILTDHIKSIKKDLKFKFYECRETMSVDSVHDLRVDLRKLMSVSELALNFQSVNPKTKKAFGKMQKLFSDTRDIHVAIGYITNKLESNSDIEGFITYLETLRTTRENLLRAKLIEFKMPKLEKKIDKMTALVSSSEFKNNFLSTLRMKLDDSFLEVVKNIELINKNDIETMHEVRIQLKNFRYLFEIHSLIFTDENERIKNLKNLQDWLGEIQDLKVLKKLLHDYSGETKTDIKEILSFIDERNDFLIESFYNGRYDVLNLWEIES